MEDFANEENVDEVGHLIMRMTILTLRLSTTLTTSRISTTLTMSRFMRESMVRRLLRVLRRSKTAMMKLSAISNPVLTTDTG